VQLPNIFHLSLSTILDLAVDLFKPEGHLRKVAIVYLTAALEILKQGSFFSSEELTQKLWLSVPMRFQLLNDLIGCLAESELTQRLMKYSFIINIHFGANLRSGKSHSPLYLQESCHE